MNECAGGKRLNRLFNKIKVRSKPRSRRSKANWPLSKSTALPPVLDIPFRSWLGANETCAHSWTEANVVAGLGRGSLSGPGSSSHVGICRWLVPAAQTSCSGHQCRKSHGRWDGENTDGSTHRRV